MKNGKIVKLTMVNAVRWNGKWKRGRNGIMEECCDRPNTMDSDEWSEVRIEGMQSFKVYWKITARNWRVARPSRRPIAMSNKGFPMDFDILCQSPSHVKENVWRPSEQNVLTVLLKTSTSLYSYIRKQHNYEGGTLKVSRVNGTIGEVIGHW